MNNTTQHCMLTIIQDRAGQIKAGKVFSFPSLRKDFTEDQIVNTLTQLLGFDPQSLSCTDETSLRNTIADVERENENLREEIATLEGKVEDLKKGFDEE